jgi:uncharacterized protein YqeY
MSLLDTVTSEIGTAMKQKDQASLGPLRMLKAALMNKEVEKVRALDDAESLQVVGRARRKQRRDSIRTISGRAGRQDSGRQGNRRAAFPGKVPAARSRSGGHRLGRRGGRRPRPGPPARRTMGKVMKAVMARLAGLSRGRHKLVSEAVKKRLSG